LFLHRSGNWCKKVRGRHVYFGRDLEAALEKYHREITDLQAGRTPRPTAEGLTVRDLCNRFLTAKQNLVSSGELVPRSWADYHATCERLIKAFGPVRLVDDLVADDFTHLRASIAKRWGAVALGNEVQRVRVIGKFAFDSGLINTPIRYGPGFKRPSRKVLRKLRASKPKKLFEAAEVRKLLDAADDQLKAMILLAINSGLGNTDCGLLPKNALALKGGWLDYPRPKTGVERRCPLWPETVKAIRAVLADRPTPKDNAHAGLVFVTKYGGSWAKDTRDNPISKEFAKLMKEQKLHRKGRSFYSLRHTFATIAGESKDQVAVNHIMGHADESMAAQYRERISDDRLRAVADHVRSWLFPKKRKAK
jgi:integrase